MARALHDYGKRRGGPFVAINMAAIPRELIESELFGHERGAFTGATNRNQGRFEQATGGTLFLDEIGDMPPEAQTRLLRVLQEGEFTSVGGRQPIRANVRIVAATHRDLRSAIRQGQFREDLFYRLNVVPIRLPPLRERTEDIAAAGAPFPGRARESTGCRPRSLDQGALDRLRQYRWPGNVRELENLMRRLAALCPEEMITAEVDRRRTGGGRAPTPARRRRRGRRREPLARAVERHIRQFLAAHDDGLTPSRHLRPGDRRGGAAADPDDAGGDARQPDQGGGDAGAQSQHAAQEDPRPGDPGGAGDRLSAAPPSVPQPTAARPFVPCDACHRR